MNPMRLLHARWLQQTVLIFGIVALGLLLGRSLWDAQRLPLTVAFIMNAFVLLLVTRHPLLGTIAWIVLYPFAPFWNLDIHLGEGVPDLGMARLAAGWTIFLLLVRAARRRIRLAPPIFIELILLLVAVVILASGLTSVYGPSAGIQAAFDAYLLPFLAFFLARQMTRRPADLRLVYIGVLLIGLYLAFLILQEQATGRVLFALDTVQFTYGTGLRRVVSLLGNPIFFGVPLAFSIVAALLLLPPTSPASPTRTFTLFIALIIFIVFIIAAYYTYNRASWAGIVLGVLIVALFEPRWRRFVVPTLVVIAVAGALAWPVLSQLPVIQERLTDEASVTDRLNNVTVALTLWRQSPLFGQGYASFGQLALEQGLLPRIAKYIPAPHNSYLFVLVSGGLVALVPYTLSFVMIALDLWRFTRRIAHSASAQQRRAVAGGWAILIIMTSTAVTYDVATAALTSLMFYFFMGAVYGIAAQSTAAA